jgi:iron complex outermembrane receptor protein
MRKPRLTLVGVLCLAWVGAADAAPQRRGLLTGVVRDMTGAPLESVAVTITGEPSALVGRALTNRHGQYEIEMLPPGRYVLDAVLEGFERVITPFEMGPDGARVDLVLTLDPRLETVTVTATKTGAADVQTTAAAVTVIPARALEQIGIETADGLAGFAPAVTVSRIAGLAQITVRGIGTNVIATGGDPSSTVHLDGVYLGRPSMAFLDLLNVDRVEILRGPQGTVYGRNSVGGTINIVTRQPGSTFDARARLAAGGYNKVRVEGAMSGPVVKNKVMGSLAVLRATHRGFVDDLGHPDRALGSEDTWAGRGQLRVVFAPAADLLLSGDYSRDDGIPLTYAKPLAAKPGSNFRFDNPGSLWTVHTSEPASGHNSQGGGAAKLVVRVNATTTLTSLTAGRRADYRALVDSDLTELPLQTLDVVDLQHQFSEEVTLVTRTPKLALLGGAFLFNERVDGPVLITLYPAVQRRPHATIDTSASAVFSQAMYQMSPRVALTGGMRYSDESKDLANTGGTYRIGTTVLDNPSTFYQFVDHVTYNAWTPKVGIQLRATADVFVYASASRGFKSGGFNPSWPEPDRPYSPEFAWSYEGGLKSTVAGGRVGANLAIFFNDYRNLQVQAFIKPGLLDITNAASAHIRGMEIEGTAAAPGRIHLSGHLAWLDAAYQSYMAVGEGGVTRDVTGNRLNNAPGWSGSGTVSRAFVTGARATISLRGDALWQSRVFFTPFNDRIETQEAYGLVHVRAGVELRQRRWEIAVYARNLGNRAYVTGTSTASIPAIGGRPGEPRLWGTQVTVRR